MATRAFSIGLIGTALLLAPLAAHAADTVSASSPGGYSRLSFAFEPAGHVTAASDGSVLTLSFDRKTTLDPNAIARMMGSAVGSARADADGKTFRFALSAPFKLHQSSQANRAVVDLAPPEFAGTMPDLVAAVVPPPKPLDVASLPGVTVRSGAYANFTRLVFDWNKDVAYSVFPGAGKMTIKFQTAAKPDLSAIARFQPPWVKNAAWHLDGNTTVVEFETDSDSGFHDFKDGTHVVLDVLAPKADTSAYAPPGTQKPVATKFDQAVAKAGVTGAQATAIADTAKQIQPAAAKPVEAKPADAKATEAKAADTKPGDAKAATAPPKALVKPEAAAAKPVDAKTADSKTQAAAVTPAPAAPPVATQVAETQVTDNTAVLNFKGANNHPSAIFVRGLTAWIVLEDAANLDAAQLKATLSAFANGIEASSSPGVSILRITLKQPATIAALDNGPDLKVVIGGKNASQPTGIGFAREQGDTARAALTTFLPRADKSFALTDPVTGDILTVIPGGSGYGMLGERTYAEFAALPSATGLVITPYTDDLVVSVAGTRIRISRPGGLSLTAPSATISNDSPQAMARTASEPGFLDFAAWGQLTGGSFLATERRLSQDVARLSGANANHARLILAHFYLANHFASEALGLIKVIQTQDPALQGDTQLTMMRAAADTMLGRTRDAQNELAGGNFDFNPHASLWRGLSEAAAENWSKAHDDLMLAGPVLKRYPAQWQARADLSDAEAALEMKRLELADSALTRLPAQLSHTDTLEAQLARARIAAIAGNYAKSVPLFAAVQNGGDEKLAAQAIYYQVDAGLNAHAVKPEQAIDVLERLRFRWRGDALEMRTLRRLAGLYFAKAQYAQGLKTLRVATQNFNDDAARSAQDDMRAEFAKLFLKGGADKMPPVEQLALFYDNVDLTPIGADGDEMIRRMADRLVNVDLLGPAASLLAYQVDKRLDGVAKAQVSTRLAEVYLMDHKAQDAVAVLHNSQITGLPDDTIHQRLILEARAFAALKQWNNALDLIAVDQSDDTRRLRADIYWESGNWAVAGQKAEELLGARFSDAAPLTTMERGEVLRMAVAYSLADDQASLDRLRGNFAAKMTSTPDASAFAVLTQNIDMHGVAFRQAAAQIASVDTLTTFMKDFSQRHNGTPKS